MASGSAKTLFLAISLIFGASALCGQSTSADPLATGYPQDNSSQDWNDQDPSQYLQRGTPGSAVDCATAPGACANSGKTSQGNWETAGQKAGGAYESSEDYYQNDKRYPETGSRTATTRLLPPDPPTEFQQYVLAATGQRLAIFGSKLFRRIPASFSPSRSVPVTADYVLGPDDELRLRVWGQISYSANLRVDRSGNIYSPLTGSVHVAGLKYSELDPHLRTAISHLYHNFDLSVDVGNLRSIQVFITGHARNPGAYTVSALSTLVDALFAAGGPAPDGSLRHIQLLRDGKKLGEFDLYALLLRGDKSADLRLLPEDVVHIPAAGPQVAVLGSIRSPGIYEVSHGENLGDLLEAAGRVSALTFSQRASVERIGTDQRREAMEIGLDAQSMATVLEDGDILRLFPILPNYRKTVTLRGSVANPGRYGWHEEMKLSELIPDRDALMSREYWWKRNQAGLPAPEFEPSSEAMLSSTAQNQSPGTANAEQVDRSQNPLGAVSTADIDTEASRNASDTGTHTTLAQQSGLNYAEKRSGTSRQSETHLAAAEIDWHYAVIERIDPQTLKVSLIPFDLGKLVLEHDASQDHVLEPGDVISIFTQADVHVPQAEQTKYITLEGEIAHAGIYSVQPGETLRDVVRRAGGLTQAAYLYGSEFDRESTRMIQQARIDEYVQTVEQEAIRSTIAISVGSPTSGGTNLTSASQAQDRLLERLKKIRATGRIVLPIKPTDSEIDSLPAISLENGDHFIVPTRPATINIVGAVYNQNSFLYKRGLQVGGYLKLAGGTNRNADTSHIMIIHADGSVLNRSSVHFAWGDAFLSLRLTPGDTLLIPDKRMHINNMKNFLDWTQAFSQLAIGAATASVL